MAQLEVIWKKKENRRLVEGKSLVFHCHHYNCHLQKTIEDSKIVGGKEIQINTAREVAFEHFSKAFAGHSDLKTAQQKLGFASDFFKIAGFGIIDFTKVNDSGGTVNCPVSHYAKGWIAKWGKRKTAMCFFNSGWIAGVLAVAFGKERYYFDTIETQCEAVSGKGCSYTVEVR